MKMNKKSMFILIGILVAVLIPLVITNNYVLSIIDLGLINAIAALGLNFIFGYTGYISFAQSAFMGIGAYASSILATKCNMPFIVCFIGGAAVAGLLGVLLGMPSLKLKGHYLAIVTIGFGVIAQLVFLNWAPVTNGVNGITNIPSPALFGFKFEGYSRFYYLVLGIVLLFMFFVYRVSKSKFGRALKSVREDETASSACGVNVKYYKVMAFALSAIFAGFAGSLYAYVLNYISPDSFSFDQSIVIFTMVLIGGAGTVIGPIIGAILLTFIPEWLRFLQGYYMAAYGAGIVILMLFMPGGIMGLKAALIDKVSKAKFRNKKEKISSENS